MKVLPAQSKGEGKAIDDEFFATASELMKQLQDFEIVRQILHFKANRVDAQKSTGTKTKAGKKKHLGCGSISDLLKTYSKYEITEEEKLYKAIRELYKLWGEYRVSFRKKCCILEIIRLKDILI